MAFDIQSWSRQSVALNTGEVTVNGVNIGGPAIFSYHSATDNIATIVAANYFSRAVYDLSLNDLIYIVGSDAVGMYVVSAINDSAGTVSLTAASLTGTVNTANIAANAVTLAKLASGVTASHIVKFGGTQNNGGGSATIAITVTGTLTSDLAFAQIQASTNAVTVQKVVPTANTVTVTLSGDPGASTIIAYQVLRAAS